jgi:YD repeat-containing protein
MRKPATVTDALGRVTTYLYGGCCNRLLGVTDPAGFTTAFTYDFKGNRLTVTDPNGLTTATAYDARDRTVSVTNAAAEQTAYAYDDDLTDGVGIETDPRVQAHLADLGMAAGLADGSAVRVTTPDDQSSIEIRDGLGRGLLRIDRLGHTTWTLNDSVSVSGLVEVRTVDALQHATIVRLDGAGRLREQVDTSEHLNAREWTTRFDYDANGNRTRQRDPNGVGADLA